MIAYNYKQRILSKVNQIPNSGDHFLNFEGLNFLVKFNESNRNIVFIFHGAIAGTGVNRVIFRGYDYKIDNTDIVCICDYLLNKHDDYKVNWTLPTKKHDTDRIYLNIIRHILLKGYEKVLFTGTSAGGYPSIKFAGIYGETALVSNPQLYLEEYGKGSNPPYGFKHLESLVCADDDELVYREKNIESHILNHRPKMIILYNNIMDSTLKRDIVPFIDFIKENQLQSILEINLFMFKENANLRTNHHSIYFPGNIKHIDVLREYFKN